MALTPAQIESCMIMLFPIPSWTNNQTGAAVAGAHETEAEAVLADLTASQEAKVAVIVTAFDVAFLNESRIEATSSNKGFSTSGQRARDLHRAQLVAVLRYDPTPGLNDFCVGRG